MSERNQKRFTIPPKAECDCVMEIWRVVAVTLEKKVAMVVMLTYRVVAASISVALWRIFRSFSSARNEGKTTQN